MNSLDHNKPRAVGFAIALVLAALASIAAVARADETKPKKWLPSKAYIIPKETAPEGEGYFAIVCGQNGRLYIGTHANAVNSFLVEFDPKAEAMKTVVDAHKAIGVECQGFAAQSKIHTLNNVGASGKIYFATKQGYPMKSESRLVYPGGYPMAYDPKTEKTEVWPIPVPHQGIISITPDESRGVAYISTCSDERPTESSHFLVLDLATGKYKDLIDTRHMYAFIVVDYLGRAYHPILGGDIARYDPRAGKLERLKQTIDGGSPSPESHLADPESHPINWDISPDGKTLYAVPMSDNHLYAYDLSAEGDTLKGKCLGTLLPGAKGTDCRSMCTGPKGDVWVAVTEAAPPGNLCHLVTYKPGDQAPRDLGPVSITNPDYTVFKDKDGKDLPFHHGLAKMEDGTTTTKYVILGVCEGQDGSVYILALAPYTLLRVSPTALSR
ncbi:MAG: hypothetical protein HYS13_23260 [Planctomycetia bacterium]|nr:hypothetical protein [Planctomycetia bacterium]